MRAMYCATGAKPDPIHTTRNLAKLMAEMDGPLLTWGIRPSRVVSDRNHESSERPIPSLLERNITFKMNVICPRLDVGRRRLAAGALRPARPYVFDHPGSPGVFLAFIITTSYPGGSAYCPRRWAFLFDRDGASTRASGLPERPHRQQAGSEQSAGHSRRTPSCPATRSPTCPMTQVDQE